MADNAPYLRSGKYINRLSTLFRAVYLGGGGCGGVALLCFFFFCFVLFCFLAKRLVKYCRKVTEDWKRVSCHRK